MKLYSKRKYKKSRNFITENILFEPDTNIKNSEIGAQKIGYKEFGEWDNPLIIAPTSDELHAAGLNPSDDRLGQILVLGRLLFDFGLVSFHSNSRRFLPLYNTANTINNIEQMVNPILESFDEDDSAYMLRDLMELEMANDLKNNPNKISRIFDLGDIISSLLDEDSCVKNQMWGEYLRHRFRLANPKAKAPERGPYTSLAQKKWDQVKAEKRQIGQPTMRFERVLRPSENWKWKTGLIKNNKINEEFLVEQLFEKFAGKNFYDVKGSPQDKITAASKIAQVIYNTISGQKFDPETIKQIKSLNLKTIANHDPDYNPQQDKSEKRTDPKKVYISKPSLAYALWSAKKSGYTTSLDINRIKEHNNIAQLAAILYSDQEIKNKEDSIKQSKNLQELGLKANQNNDLWFDLVFDNKDFDFQQSISLVVNAVTPQNTLNQNKIDEILANIGVQNISFCDLWWLINDLIYYYHIDYEVLFDYIDQYIVIPTVDRNSTVMPNSTGSNQSTTDNPSENEQQEETDDNTINEANNTQKADKVPDIWKRLKESKAKALTELGSKGGYTSLNMDRFVQYVKDALGPCAFPDLNMNNYNSDKAEIDWDNAMKGEWKNKKAKIYIRDGRILNDPTFDTDKTNSTFIDDIINNSTSERGLSQVRGKYGKAISAVTANLNKQIKGLDSNNPDKNENFYNQCVNILRWSKRLVRWINSRLAKGKDVQTIINSILHSFYLDDKIRTGQKLGLWGKMDFKELYRILYTKGQNPFIRKLYHTNTQEGSITIGDIKKILTQYYEDKSHQAVVSNNYHHAIEFDAVRRLREIQEDILDSGKQEGLTLPNFIKYLEDNNKKAIYNFYKYGIADAGGLNQMLKNDDEGRGMPQFISSRRKKINVPVPLEKFVTWDSFEKWEDLFKFLYAPDKLSYIYNTVIGVNQRSRVFNTVRGGQYWQDFKRVTIALAMNQYGIQQLESDPETSLNYIKNRSLDAIKDSKKRISRSINYTPKMKEMAEAIVAGLKEFDISRTNWDWFFDVLETEIEKIKDKLTKEKSSKEKNKKQAKEENIELNDENEASDAEKIVKEKYRSIWEMILSSGLSFDFDEEEIPYLISLIRLRTRMETNSARIKEIEDVLSGTADEERKNKITEYANNLKQRIQNRMPKLVEQQKEWIDKLQHHLDCCKTLIMRNAIFLSNYVNFNGTRMKDMTPEEIDKRKAKADATIKNFQSDNAYLKKIFEAIGFKNTQILDTREVDKEIIKQYDGILKALDSLDDYTAVIQALDNYAANSQRFASIPKEILEAYNITEEYMTDVAQAAGQSKRYTSFATTLKKYFDRLSKFKADVIAAKTNKNAGKIYKAQKKLLYPRCTDVLIDAIKCAVSNNHFVENLEILKKNLDDKNGLNADEVVFVEKTKETLQELQSKISNDSAVIAVTEGQQAYELLTVMKSFAFYTDKPDEILDNNNNESYNFVLWVTYSKSRGVPKDLQNIDANEGFEMLNSQLGFTRKDQNGNEVDCGTGVVQQVIQQLCFLHNTEVLDFWNKKYPNEKLLYYTTKADEKDKEYLDGFFNGIKININPIVDDAGLDEYGKISGNYFEVPETSVAKQNNGDGTTTNVPAAPDDIVENAIKDELKAHGVLINIEYSSNDGVKKFLHGSGIKKIIKIIQQCTIETELKLYWKPSTQGETDTGEDNTNLIRSKNIDASKILERLRKVITRNGVKVLLLDGQDYNDGLWYAFRTKFQRTTRNRNFLCKMVWFLIKRGESYKETKKIQNLRFNINKEKDKKKIEEYQKKIKKCQKEIEENKTNTPKIVPEFCKWLKRDIQSKYMQDTNVDTVLEYLARLGTKAQRDKIAKRKLEDDVLMDGSLDLVIESYDLSNKEQLDAFKTISKKNMYMEIDGLYNIEDRIYNNSIAIVIKFPLCLYRLREQFEETEFSINTYISRFNRLHKTDLKRYIPIKEEDIYGQTYAYTEKYEGENKTFEEFLRFYGFKVEDFKDSIEKDFDKNKLEEAYQKLREWRGGDVTYSSLGGHRTNQPQKASTSDEEDDGGDEEKDREDENND